MDKQFELMYKEYLNNTLDIIFSDDTGVKTNNPWYEEHSKDDDVKEIDLGYENVEYDSDSGTTIVEKHSIEYNLLDKNGNLVFDYWYHTSDDKPLSFHDGYACVKNKNGCNYIDRKGNLLCKEDFYDVKEFHDGYAVVETERGKFTYIDTKGNPISDNYYEEAENFNEGYAKVVIDGKDYFIDTKGNRTFDESYYKNNPNIKYENFSSYIESDLVEGYAVVCVDNKYNYIDVNGNLLSKDKWFSEAYTFSEGLARVKIDDKIEVIDNKGTIVSDKWDLPKNSRIEGDFHDGCARISIGGTYNYVNKSGRILVEKTGFSEESDFSNGYAAAYREVSNIYKYEFYEAFIDTKGKYIIIDYKDRASKCVDSAWGLNDEYIVLCYDPKYYYSKCKIVNSKGEPLSPFLFDTVNKTKDGIIVVKKDRFLYSLNSNGELTSLSPIMNSIVKECPAFIKTFTISSEEKVIPKYYYVDKNIVNVSRVFDGYTKVSDGVYQVKRDGKYSLFYTKNNTLLNGWYDDIRISGKFALAAKNYEIFLINIDTKEEKKLTYSKDELRHFFDWKEYSISSYENGYAIVRVVPSGWDSAPRCNIIDAKGKWLFDKWYRGEFLELKNGFIKVEQYYDDHKGILDLKGNKVVPYKKHIDYKKLEISSNFFNINGNLSPIKIDMNELSVTQKTFGYQVSDKTSTFKIKYRPVKNYDNRYLICVDKENVILYDREFDSYENLGTNVEYDDNFINKNSGETIYFMINGQKIDITDYYNKKLKNKKEISILRNVLIKKPSDFYGENENEIREKFRESLKENERLIQEKKQKEDIEGLRQAEKQEEFKAKRLEILGAEAAHLIGKAAEYLDTISEEEGINELRKVSKLWSYAKDGHKYVNPVYFVRNFFAHIDMSDEDFDNADIRGLDLSNHNIQYFNPQNLYKKDMRGCTLDGIIFPATTKFDGVNICGCKFTTDPNPRTLNINKDILSKGIYDGETTLDGVPLVELLNEVENERGSKTA